MTPLRDYHGLLDLLLNEGNLGHKFDLNGVPCEIEALKGGHALFTAATPVFGIAVFFPRWYLGEVIEPLVQIGIKGNRTACFKWLPIEPEDKRAIIKRIPMSRLDRVLLMLAV